MGDLEDLIITGKAVKAIKECLEHEGAKALRISLKADGCSGLKYDFSSSMGPEENDLVFEKDGAIIYVNKKNMNYLKGSTVDFIDKLIGGGIRIDNPNLGGMCGCGESFYIKPN